MCVCIALLWPATPIAILLYSSVSSSCRRLTNDTLSSLSSEAGSSAKPGGRSTIAAREERIEKTGKVNRASEFIPKQLSAKALDEQVPTKRKKQLPTQEEQDLWVVIFLRGQLFFLLHAALFFLVLDVVW